MFQRPLHVQQHQNETAHHRFVGTRPQRLQGQGHADDHEEQHRAKRLGDDEGVDRSDLGVADFLGGFLNAGDEHALAARAVNTQFLGTFGNRVVMLLQFVFGVAGGVEAAHAFGPGDGLDGGADGDGHQHHQKHRPRQHGQVAEAAKGHGHGNRQRREGEGEVADGVDVVGQHRNQAMAAIAFDLIDRRRQDFLPQLFAQFGDDVLADVVGADVRQDRGQQGQGTEAGEDHHHRAGQAVIGMQGVVDGRQQHGYAQAAEHAEHDGRRDDQAEWLEQGEQFVDRPTRRLGHGGFLLRCGGSAGT